MKNKFERLSKEEQENAIEEYAEAREQNKIVVKKVKNLRVLSIAGIIYSVLSFAFDVLTNAKVFFYIFDGCLLVTCVFLFIKSKDLLHANVNEFLISKKKEEMKKEYKKEYKKELEKEEKAKKKTKKTK